MDPAKYTPLARRLYQELDSIKRTKSDTKTFTGLDSKYVDFIHRNTKSGGEVEVLIEMMKQKGRVKSTNGVQEDKRNKFNVLIHPDIKEALREQEEPMSTKAVEIWHNYRREKL